MTWANLQWLTIKMNERKRSSMRLAGCLQNKSPSDLTFKNGSQLVSLFTPLLQIYNI